MLLERDKGRSGSARGRGGTHHALAAPLPPPPGPRHASTPSAAPALRIVSDLGGIESLESDWRALTPPDAAPFTTFAWNLAWYRSYADRMDEPLVFAVSAGRRTVAILPCYRVGRRIRLAGDLVCDYQDIVARDRDSAATGLRHVLSWLLIESPGLRFHFEKVSSEGWILQLAPELCERIQGLLPLSKCYAPCPVVSIRGGLESYLGSLPRKRRQDLRRSLNRLEREAPGARVQIREDLDIQVRDLEEAADFHAAHFRMGGSGPLADPRLRALLAEVAKEPDTGLQISVLREGEEILAVDFGFAKGGRYYGYLGAFDSARRKLAPGKCLLLRRIDTWAGAGLETLDFLAGCEPYKEGFTSGERYEVRTLHLMADTLPHRVRAAVFRLDRFLRCAVKGAARRLGLWRRDAPRC